ncbi:MAG: thiopurine S-methyltransferase [Gammaproteobacteria bacterium]|jgi:thiopurine S-methyltransferase|nr:thiopurine S-methyltransferase [Gammaproteobacteria bacterium]
MDRDFWHARWEGREIGFHRSDTHWALERHWHAISANGHGRVLVPLSGKSLDMRWLADQGHDVVGVELSGQAVREFYDEWGKAPTEIRMGSLRGWRAGNIELFEGDFFDFETDRPFELFYDRAALVALPRDMRVDYLGHLRSQLSNEARGLLVTFEYDQSRMDGPPFSVPEDELMQYPGLRFELLERIDALPDNARFAERGLTALHECAWVVAPV